MQVYKASNRLKKHGNTIKVIWKPMKEDFPRAKMTKMAARKSTEQDSYPEKRIFKAKSTTLNLARKGQSDSPPLPEWVGAWSKRMNMALPGRHTRMLYDPLRLKEAGILAQLATHRNNTAELLSTPNRSSAVGPMCMRTRERNYRTLSF
jgi:hypothetical protein